MGAMFMKPSGKVELLIITQMPPFRTSWLYLVPPFTLQRYELFLKVPNILAKKSIISGYYIGFIIDSMKAISSSVRLYFL